MSARKPLTNPRPRRFLAGFATHAAAVAIRARLDDARGRLAVAESEVRWLEELLVVREAEVAAGAWPYPDRCATCPRCGLKHVPLIDGQLAAHAWATGRYVDGPDDEDGNPGPGEWVGGCGNREPGNLSSDL